LFDTMILGFTVDHLRASRVVGTLLLARRLLGGGNATGFTSFSYDIGGKWLELLKEIAPRVTRVAVVRDSNITAGVGQWSAVQTAAPSFGMEASPINLREAAERR
jgi:putative ABC transport system substrate-binding protein